jgi:PHD/YefM family antitoxin component YafN of YafNO toxin-antitoxin module
MSTPVKEQYIIDAEGNKTAIILSIEQYEQMLEDLHDLAVVAERRTEQSVSLANMQEWLKEDGIL